MGLEALMLKLATARRAPAASLLLHGIGGIHVSLSTLALVGAVVVNAALAVAVPSSLWTISALLLYGLALARLGAAQPGALFMLAPFVVLHVAMMVSLVGIESGALMGEIGLTGHASPAGALYVVYALIFIGTAAAVLRQLEPQGTQVSSGRAAGAHWILCWAGFAIAGGAAGYLFLAGLRTGFPLLMGADRLLFRASGADIVTLNLLNLKHTIAAAAGVGAAFAKKGGVRYAHHGAFGLFLAASFLYGDKFFIIVIASCFYFMPFVLRDAGGVARTVKRATPVLALVLFSMSIVTYYIYSEEGARSHEETMDRLSQRVAGQGQLWFAAVGDSSEAFSFDVRQVTLNLGSLVANPGAVYVLEHRIAAFYFIERYAPTTMHRSFVKNGGAVTPTMVLEAYGLLLFGFVGLAVLLALIGAGIGVLLHCLRVAMLSANPINALLPAFVCAQAIVFVAQATLYSLLSPSAFKAYAAFLVLQLAVAAYLRRLSPINDWARHDPPPRRLRRAGS